MEIVERIPVRAWSILLCIPALALLPDNTVYSQVVFWIGLLLIGIPHGAIDHHLQLKEKAYHWPDLLIFIGRYIGLMLIFLVFWMYSSEWAILFFVLLSGWHFGMVDFKHPNSIAGKLKAFIYGFSLLLVILLSHKSEVLSILRMLKVDDIYLDVFLSTENVPLIITGIVLFVSIVLSGKHYLWWTFALLLIGTKLPLLLVFGIYFSFQHGLTSMLETKKFLKVNWLTFSKMTFPFTAAAYVLGMVIFLMLSFSSIQIQELIPYAFLFLGMVTLPHVVYYHLENK
jgi:Brp/Blh family beta-carotene 15,15'-monooxygenase